MTVAGLVVFGFIGSLVVYAIYRAVKDAKKGGEYHSSKTDATPTYVDSSSDGGFFGGFFDGGGCGGGGGGGCDGG